MHFNLRWSVSSFQKICLPCERFVFDFKCTFRSRIKVFAITRNVCHASRVVGWTVQIPSRLVRSGITDSCSPSLCHLYPGVLDDRRCDHEWGGGIEVAFSLFSIVLSDDISFLIAMEHHAFKNSASVNKKVVIISGRLESQLTSSFVFPVTP